MLTGLIVVSYFAILNLNTDSTVDAANYSASNLSTMQSCPRDANCYYNYYYDCVTFASVNVQVFDITNESTPVDVSSEYRNYIDVNTQKNSNDLWKIRMTEVGPNGEDTCRVPGLQGGIWTGDKCNTQYEEGASYYASGKPGDDLWCFNGPFEFDIDIPAGYELVNIDNNGHGTVSGTNVSNINLCGTGQSRYAQQDRDYTVYVKRIEVNNPPVCTVNVNPMTGTSPLDVTITLDSDDPDNDTLQSTWTVCGEQISVNGDTYTTTISETGVCQISVTVIDPDGATDTCTTVVNVSAPQPSVEINKTTRNLTDRGNDEYEVEFELVVTNTGDSVLHDIQVTDDLTDVFNDFNESGDLEIGDYRIASAPESSLGANVNFNGDTDQNLLDITIGTDTLAVGESQSITFNVLFKAPKGETNYRNIAIVTADITEDNNQSQVVSDTDPSDFNVDIENQNPVCEVTPTVSEIIAGETVTFNVTANDSDGSIDEYLWFVGDTQVNNSGPTYTTMLDTVGNNVIKVVVVDNNDSTAECTTTVTVNVLQPNIDIQKDHSNVELNTNDQTYSVDFNINVTNTGDTVLHDIQVVDDLTEVFGTYVNSTNLQPGQYTITNGPTSVLGVNTNYNGDSDKNLLDITVGTDTLAINETESISMSIKFKPATFDNIDQRTFTNEADVTADTNEDNQEGKEVTAEDPTEFTVTSLPNEGPVCTVNVNVSDANVGEEVVFTVSANDPDGDIVEYVWEINGDLISNTSDTYTVTFDNPGTYTAVVTVKDDEGDTVNCQNSVVISQLNPSLEVEKTYRDLNAHDDYSYDVEFVVTVTNTGDAVLHDIQVTDDLTNVFGEYKDDNNLEDGQYTIIESANSELGANTDFNGSSDQDLLDITVGSDTLNVGESEEITFRVKFKPSEGTTTFDNVVVATADTEDDDQEGKEVDDNDNTKFEVSERENKTPICEIELENKDGDELNSSEIDENKIPQKFYFDAGGSEDEDGEIKEYHWEVKKDGKTITDDFDKDDKKIDYEFTEPGKYLVSVKIVDDDGLTKKCDEEFELREGDSDTYLTCQDNACVEVEGDGQNECSIDADCRVKGGAPVPETGFEDNFFGSAAMAIVATVGFVAGGMYLIP